MHSMFEAAIAVAPSLQSDRIGTYFHNNRPPLEENTEEYGSLRFISALIFAI
jgi:hypothetical protein